MHLTICLPRGPGHDSSVGELMHFTVSPIHGRVKIAQRNNDRITLSIFSLASVQFKAI